MKKAFFLLLSSVLLTLAGCTSSTALREKGAFLAPSQKSFLTSQPAIFLERDYWLEPVAAYEVDVLVKATERYRLGELSNVAPVDFVLTWGKLAEPHVLPVVKVEQADRNFSSEVSDESLLSQLSQSGVEALMANTHLVPSSSAILDQLLAVKPGQALRAKGYLVDILHKDVQKITRSSRKRTDTGAASSEVFYVLEMEVLDPGY